MTKDTVYEDDISYWGRDDINLEGSRIIFI